jgi:carboxyl-terminal processing protease
MMLRPKRRFLWVIAGGTLVLTAAKQADDLFEISKNLEIFHAAYKEVNAHYVDELKPGEMMKKGLDAMLSGLDPYTVFYSEAQAEEALIDREGEYSGVGCQVEIRNGYPVVTEIYGGFAFAKADVRPGDIIRQINGRDLKGLSRDAVGNLLRGGAGTSLNLRIDRMGKTIDKQITREEIRVKNVPYFGMIDGRTGYIKLNQFGENCAAEVRNALLELKKNPGMQSLVLDLRWNGGGLLNEAVEIVNLFVPRDQLVVSTKGRAGGLNRDFRTVNAPVDLTIPVAVLVNHRSASASEIVSGTLQDLDRAVVVGRNSFGKGLVQNTFPLPYRTQVKVTTAKYYTPSGRCIQLLDYSKRNSDGSAGSIADSQRRAFRTRGGRTVYDGGGVKPDLVVDDTWNKGLYKLLNDRRLIFEFANRYRNTHDSIPPAGRFGIGESDFSSFMNLAADSLSNWWADQQRKQSKQALGDEDLGMVDIERIWGDFNRRIREEQKGIVYQLEAEIARRYYFENAAYEKGLNEDPDVRKATELLLDPVRYNRILGR